MNNNLFAKRSLILSTCILGFIVTVLLLAACGRNRTEKYEISNLYKLCKVWGFTKYTHLAFLTGETCWDKELVNLIPIVQLANPEDVNDILYNWFIGLGDDGYDLDVATYRVSVLERFPYQHDSILVFFDNAYNLDWPDIWVLEKELWLLETGREINMRSMANLNWVNEDFLGLQLYSALSRFNKVQTTDRIYAPVYFNHLSISAFTNQNSHTNMCYTNSVYRLLGLFRLWNAMKYYFPYLDIVDACWDELLLVYIQKMLNGTDRLSYLATLKSLASNLHDAHIFFASVRGDELFAYMFGVNVAPVRLAEAEGQLVVSEVYFRNRDLMPGDVIQKVNGVCIKDITASMLRYLSYPNAEKALAFLTRREIILRQHSGRTPMEIYVLRDGDELKLNVQTVSIPSYVHMNLHIGLGTPRSRTLLENNIGLISPVRIVSRYFPNPIPQTIMQEFAYTNGLIIDMRQYGTSILHELAEFLLDDLLHYYTVSTPLLSVPGVFIDSYQGYTGPGVIANLLQDTDDWFQYLGLVAYERLFDSFFYQQNVVILMNENTFSAAETAVMALRNGPNVTVMGSNSMGANGDVVRLPLPGAVDMFFSSIGIFTPEGGQTQRIGLSPDIYVPRTIAGIRDGRDELMEAAVQFLLLQLP